MFKINNVSSEIHVREIKINTDSNLTLIAVLTL